MQILIAIKKHEKSGGISKLELSAITGINHNSIVKWRKAYLQGGIDVLLTHGRKGLKQSIFTQEEHTVIQKKLEDPCNDIVGIAKVIKEAYQDPTTDNLQPQHSIYYGQFIFLG